ncbi:complex I intermediate-associated protein 30, mitochondrial isoform X2 [Lingula anatina]|nr:complex I intermediate-associated protein 30, mitochondrial isoform X2 [Lingula anatina]|eukprot:XP_013414582.1 complex I intermediate-associated protein 30, mitochondrial isoform X2 [Lingula anatina]
MLMARPLTAVLHSGNNILKTNGIQRLQTCVISKRYKRQSVLHHKKKPPSYYVGIPTTDEVIENFPQHLKMWGKKLRNNPLSLLSPISQEISQQVRHGDLRIVWKFKGEDSLNDWILSTDKQENLGFSEAELVLTKNNHGHFRGTLATTIQNRELQERAGYCSLINKRRWESFGRRAPFDWSDYTHLVIRCRGDGRVYGIGLGRDEQFNLNFYDMHNFFLYTRGGPYWQTIKIPFSKFFFTNSGIINDVQRPLDLSRVAVCSIIIADGTAGPFSLELDYIGVYCDKEHKEVHAYEMYRTSMGDHS